MRRISLIMALCGAPALSASAQDIWATPQATPAPEAHPSEVPPSAAPATASPAPSASPVQPEPSASPVQPEPSTPNVVPDSAPDTYEGHVLLGLKQTVLRDFDAAIASLRRAAQIESGSAAAFCHLGDAELERGELDEAKAAYESCARFASVAGDARHTSLAFVGLARATERGQGALLEKRDAWARARDGVSESSAKVMAEGRLAAFEAVLSRENEYQAVRARIEQRKQAK